MEKCPYFRNCNYGDLRACKSNYESCTIYQRKEMLEKIEMRKLNIYSDKEKALENKL